MSTSQWNSLKQKAKTMESRLESKIQRYSLVAQKINAEFLSDEENPLMGSIEERELSSEIERDLRDLADCIISMRNCALGSSSSHQEVLIKRYHEIHFDYSAEFKTISSAVQRKIESMELFKTSRKGGLGEQDPSILKLQKERSSLAASMKSINDVISQAFETRNALTSQRTTLSGVTGGLHGLSANMPSFNRLIDGIQRKKYKESLVVALLIGVLICFTFWWLLR